jgi:hypothetical protein
MCAFEYSGLIIITIPASVTIIESNVFGGCGNLTDIIVSEGNKNYKSIDGILFNSSVTELLQYPEGKTGTTYTVPNGVTTIGEDAFVGITYLEEIILPNSLTSILNDAFFACHDYWLYNYCLV